LKSLPEFNKDGDLPAGVYQATLSEVKARFGANTLQRRLLARRLEKIWNLVSATGEVYRFIIFGSFVTAKDEPTDIDIFLLMENSFDASKLANETAMVFDHTAAQNYEGASVFWMRCLAVLDGEDAAVGYWQTKRDGTKRGIVEVVGYD